MNHQSTVMGFFSELQTMPRNSRRLPVPRKRSCANCRTAKTRCSLTFPICTRCKSRHLNCDYGPQTQESKSDLSDTWIRDTSTYPVAEAMPNNAPSGPEALQTVFSIREEPSSVSPQVSRNSGFSNRNGDQLDINWNPEDDSLGHGGTTVPADKLSSMMDFATAESDGGMGMSNFQQSSNSDNQLQSFQGPSTAFGSDILEDIVHDGNFSDLQGSSSITCSFTTNWPISTDLPKSYPNLLNPKKLKSLGSFLTSTYIRSIFNSYPRQVCEKLSLPPFIHPRYPDQERDRNSPNDRAPSELPECLAICASLVHMYQSRSPASIAYIWKTVAAEQARLYSEFKGYDKWKLLSALQAVTIYLIMHGAEEKHDNEIAFMLVVTMGELSAKLFAENGYYSMSELNGNFSDWDEWVFAESCRRTMMLLFIMEVLHDINIDLTPPTACTGFDSVPLPCSEKLWRAETRASWEAAYKQYLAGRRGPGLLKYGTLRQSQQLETGVVDKSCLEDLETWCTGIDAFGTVVMMVARGI